MNPQSLADLLLPCPFCGGAPAIGEWASGKSKDWPDATAIECQSGLGHCPINPGYSAFTRAEAITAWNTRQAAAEVRGGVKRGQYATDFGELRRTSSVGSIIPGGSWNTAIHQGSILIGSNLTSDHDYQLKVGTADSNQSITLTYEQWLAATVALCPQPLPSPPGAVGD